MGGRGGCLSPRGPHPAFNQPWFLAQLTAEGALGLSSSAQSLRAAQGGGNCAPGLPTWHQL